MSKSYISGFDMPMVRIDTHTAETDDFKTTLYEVERHINNYFNNRNDPRDPTRNYPAAFIELVKKIAEFQNQEKDSDIPKNATSHSIADDGASESVSQDILNNDWIKLFARELSIFKRVKFI
jgi:hypothetical protein